MSRLIAEAPAHYFPSAPQYKDTVVVSVHGYVVSTGNTVYAIVLYGGRLKEVRLSELEYVNE